MPWVVNDGGDGLRLEDPVPFDERQVLQLINDLEAVRQNFPEGICEALRHGLTSRRVTKNVLLWFSTWCETNPKPQAAARVLGQALFTEYPPRFCDGQPPNHKMRGNGETAYLDWVQRVTGNTPLQPPLATQEGSPTMRELHSAIGLLQQFGQIILYGPPGTGKTLHAQRVALELLKDSRPNAPATPPAQGALSQEEVTRLNNLQDKERFTLVVFHPTYEYEQFVIGISPGVGDNSNGGLSYKVEPGIFWKICKQAEQGPAVLIIDEINRGNLPKLLGELVYA